MTRTPDTSAFGAFVIIIFVLSLVSETFHQKPHSSAIASRFDTLNLDYSGAAVVVEKRRTPHHRHPALEPSTSSTRAPEASLASVTSITVFAQRHYSSESSSEKASQH
ncbi:hypothetical protein J3458_000148 [Metarhizium acridum]|uniref:uncharacterized protein n=1 Tax=Metarhizium acridum TaxID=92637 RepID=UPI001C6AAFD6|nr:hypothetical protein J3458_000148 [Metarhizium acridum]